MKLSLPGAMVAIVAIAAALAACSGLVGCERVREITEQNIHTDTVANRGKELIRSHGCGGCHTIPGIYTARGMVGPPLVSFSRRTMIAGELPNSPENLARWVQNPKAVEPGTAMPDLGLTEYEARDVAAYLNTLR